MPGRTLALRVLRYVLPLGALALGAALVVVFWSPGDSTAPTSASASEGGGATLTRPLLSHYQRLTGAVAAPAAGAARAVYARGVADGHAEMGRVLEERQRQAEAEAARLAAISYAAELAAAAPPAGVSYAPGERWIAVDIARQRTVAFEGGTPVHVALVTTGDDGWETPKGEFRINLRIENETMDSLTIGIPRDDPWGYYLDDVLYTQYFVGGVALHYNYWRDASYFGNVRSSHGCVGMLYDDALFFWNFATTGTRVVVF